MANTIKGKILHIYPPQTITVKTGNQITKRAIVIDCTRYDPMTGERGFENTPKLEFVGDKCTELDRYQVGQIVEIAVDIQGSRYRNKEGVEDIFTRVHPYRIDPIQVQQQAPQPQAYHQQQQAPQQYVQQSYAQPVQAQPVPQVNQGDLPF